MRLAAVLALTLAGCATADQAPVAQAFIRQADLDTVTVTWRQVADPSDECRKLGVTAPIPYTTIACAYKPEGWAGPRCLMVTSQAPALATIGHELKHCFGWSH